MVYKKLLVSYIGCMEEKTDDSHNSNTVSSHVRGETMAYALQSGAFSILANIYEPSIGLLVQKKYYQKYAKDAPVHERYGTYVQNLTGELVGDLTGAGTLLLAESLAPETLHRFTRSARKVIDPLFTSVAHNVFFDEKGTPGYEKRMEEWKIFQERNFVRSGIIASTGMVGNLLAQKLLVHNPSPTGVIFLGKALSTSVTTTLGLAVRFAFPDQMKSFDSWISKKYLAPKLNEKSLDDDTNTSHVSKLNNSTNNLQPAR